MRGFFVVLLVGAGGFLFLRNISRGLPLVINFFLLYVK